MRCATNVATIAVLTLLLAGFGKGDVFQWDAPGGGSFDNAGNWNPPGVPGMLDEALFGLAALYQVDFANDATNDRLEVVDGDVILDLGGHYVYTLLGTGGNSISVSATPISYSHLGIQNGRLSAIGETVVDGDWMSGVEATLDVLSGGHLETMSLVVGENGPAHLYVDGNLGPASVSVGPSSGGVTELGVDPNVGVGILWSTARTPSSRHGTCSSEGIGSFGGEGASYRFPMVER